MRQQQSLSGQWQFQLDPQGALSIETLHPDRVIPVPMPIQAAFPELQQVDGFAWYSRVFMVEDLDGELLLDFGAVDYWCQVFVNGALVGEHEGGYTPFRIPLRRWVQTGENTLVVRVYDAVQKAITVRRWVEQPAPEGSEPPFNAETIPHGKQTWYLDASGIWQDVTLTRVPARYIERVQVTPNIHTGEASVRVLLAGAAQGVTARVTIAGVTVEAALVSDQTEATLTVHVPDAQWWTPDTPTLYTARVEIGDDALAVRFGFREIRAEGGQLLLNGAPFYLLCALDQDLYPDTIMIAPSEAFLRDQFTKAKQLGLNSLRCHIKPPEPRYLDLADEIGLLIWAEIPSWRTFYGNKSNHPAAYFLDTAVTARAQATLEAMIARDYNHPSLMIWTIINEDWGTTLLLSAADRAWIAGMYDLAKRLDPTRLVVDNSPCPAPWGLSVHVKSDLDDFHTYTNIPDQADQFEQFVEGLSRRPLWSFSNAGDSQRTGGEPLILSEFGNWGLPSLRQFGGGEPEWAALSGWWSPFDGEAGRAEGLLERFGQLGLNAIWKDYEAFAEATQWHQFQALKHEIEAMRRLNSLQGYVITELSDIYWESNGLLDFARGAKAFHQRLGEFNAEDVIVPKLDRYAYWDDETVRLRLFASHYSAADWADAAAAATTEAGEAIFAAPVGGLNRGEVRDLGVAVWTLPRVDAARLVDLSLSIDGQTPLARNTVSVLVLPAESRRAAFQGETALLLRQGRGGYAPALDAAGELLRQQGYRAAAALGGETRLVISDYPSEEVLAWVRAGGRLLYLANNAGSPFYWVHGRGGNYGGRWITSWSWLRPGAYRRVPTQNPLTLPFMDMMPHGVILGLPLEDPATQANVLAGQLAGWVRHPAVHTVEFAYGQGRVLMTTYPIREALSFQPLALAMLNDLVDHLTGAAP
ncbi:MAG: hypothetical protein JNL42_10115 [Anaerolineae bacterium]|nr:hypothetical protein [Anaerolineae bacterium]